MSSNFTINPAVESVLADLEIQRKEIVSSKLKGWGAVVLGLVGLVAVSTTGQMLIALLVGAAAIIPGVVILYRLAEKTGLYKNRFKNEVIGAALSTIDPSLTLSPYEGISEGEFRSSQLFTTSPDRYHTEDLVRGKAGKTSFYFAEVHAEYKTETQTKSGRQVQWHDILKGIVFSADFNKNFNGVTVVRPKDLGSSIGAWFSKNVFSFGDKNVVQLENDNFNKKFVTYSTDQIEARYILTPAMMEKISALDERSAYTVSVSFVNSSLYIAFPLNKNYFEPPVFKTLLKPDLLDDDMSVLGFMYDIIQELDLNTRIWTKQ
ncbi:DUF3137 domain-containing protein [Pedobacter sp. Hv1]|uniref:DUF3137 domain-containing protein n=1 Tax=Pedobacter sp. Hv1 TaxID=1740090 RepID=UPI0006D8992F|nr:DUF3137 domain-containing protein [Pedobacter sp. Hv1]KQB99298.1 galanin [Pedobacter sp. Hv1]